MRFAQWVVLFLCLACSTGYSATRLAVDLDPETSGIQNQHLDTQTGALVAVAIVIEETDKIFSLQFRVKFDTAQFAYAGCDKDFGISGPRNMLAANGGIVQGLCQPRQNPPEPGAVEFAYTITGQDQTDAVTGSGLAGLLYLRSKVAPGDSARVQITSGYWAELDGPLNTIDEYSPGVYRIDAPVDARGSKSSAIQDRESGEIHAFVEKDGTLRLLFPHSAPRAEVNLFNARGMRVARHVWTPVSSEPVAVRIDQFQWSAPSTPGVYLCAVHAGAMSSSIPLCIGANGSR